MAASNTSPPTLFVGLDLAFVHDVKSALEQASTDGFEFLCLPIGHLSHEFRFRLVQDISTPSTEAEARLTFEDLSCDVVAKCGQNIDCESLNTEERRQSELTLLEELNNASTLTLGGVQIPLTKANNVNLGRIISEKLSEQAFSCQVLMQVPMTSPPVQELSQRVEPDMWERWNNFRNICSYNKRIGVVLELTSNLPSKEEIALWLAEPVHSIWIPVTRFLSNRNLPVLSEAHQAVLRAFFPLDVNVVISGPKKNACKKYVKYIKRLWKDFRADDSSLSHRHTFENVPLQPLMDDRESQKYKVLDKDPVK